MKNIVIFTGFSSLYLIEKSEPLVTDFFLGVIIEILGGFESIYIKNSSSTTLANLSAAIILKLFHPSFKVWNFLLSNPYKSQFLHKFFNFGFKFESQTIPSDVQVFYPHEIAAYHLIVATEGRPSRANYIPLQTSPFPMPSQEGAEFYRRLLHNSVIFDPTITDQKNPEKLRALHINEVSRLLALYVARRGSAHAFWDLSRDGPIKDYDYSIPR